MQANILCAVLCACHFLFCGVYYCQNDPFNNAALMNKIKCLTNIGNWEEALEVLTRRVGLLGANKVCTSDVVLIARD